MRICVFASGNGSNFENLIELERIGYLKGRILLLITDRPCGAIDKAKKFSVDFIATKDDDKIIEEIEKREIDLIVLAGYLSKLGENIVKKYEGRIINIHPALLPSFGGKGFYGKNVHQKVVESGVRLSGITIHYVNEEYDSGKIIFQKSVFVNPIDTPQKIEEKIHEIEYFYYPFVINMISEGIIKYSKGNVIFDTQKKTSSKHAVISLTDKEGAVEFARKLNEKGYLIISTGGTYKLFKENGIKCLSIQSITGFDEIMDGRVKTLNNIIFGGILADESNPNHINQMNELFIPRIDLVAVNLYNFKDASKNLNPFDNKLMEQIDIGGVSLLRAGAKNYKNVIVICDKEDYNKVLSELDNPSQDLRKYLAKKAFIHTAKYDSMIAEKLSEGDFKNLTLKKIENLRYGENPHQKAEIYTLLERLPFIKLWGKELSYNNILDAYSSWQAVCDFESPACVIFKHLTPCGIAKDIDISKAFEKAYSCDPLSAFGGVIAVNRKVTQSIAEFLSSRFIEIISAPDFDEKAIEILKKKKNLRILKWEKDIRNSKIIRSIGDEIIISEPDNVVISEKWDVVSGEISEEEKEALLFAYTCVKHVKSNAIVLTSKDMTVGIGSGQMSRIDAVYMAGYKYSEYLKNNPKPNILVMASDAFFPFDDSIIKAKELGVVAIIQPGGSIRDDEVINTARKLGIKMVLTGIRHFRH